MQICSNLCVEFTTNLGVIAFWRFTSFASRAVVFRLKLNADSYTYIGTYLHTFAHTKTFVCTNSSHCYNVFFTDIFTDPLQLACSSRSAHINKCGTGSLQPLFAALFRALQHILRFTQIRVYFSMEFHRKQCGIEKITKFHFQLLFNSPILLYDLSTTICSIDYRVEGKSFSPQHRR